MWRCAALNVWTSASERVPAMVCKRACASAKLASSHAHHLDHHLKRECDREDMGHLLERRLQRRVRSKAWHVDGNRNRRDDNHQQHEPLKPSAWANVKMVAASDPPVLWKRVDCVLQVFARQRPDERAREHLQRRGGRFYGGVGRGRAARQLAALAAGVGVAGGGGVAAGLVVVVVGESLCVCV